MQAIFIGGPLDGKEDIEVPSDAPSELRIPFQEHFCGHPSHKLGKYVYQFDGLAWRYVRTEED